MPMEKTASERDLFVIDSSLPECFGFLPAELNKSHFHSFILQASQSSDNKENEDEAARSSVT